MELTGERSIPASRARTWEALNDTEVLKACIAGCESLEREGDDGMLATVAMKVGPVSARFKGKLKLSDMQPPESYTIHFDGQGGVAGFGKGSAQVSLVEAGPSTTTLKYTAKAQVGGKLAQVGSRLVDAAAAKVAEDFFKAFEARLSEEAQGAATGGAVVSLPVPVAQPKGDSLATLWWVVGITVSLVVLYFVLR